MHGVYLVLILLSLTGLAVLDRRFRLAFWVDARRTTVILVVSILFFLLWDMNGIARDVFAKGGSDALVGWDVFPELPVEEFFFLTLLSYCALILF